MSGIVELIRARLDEDETRQHRLYRVGEAWRS